MKAVIYARQSSGDEENSASVELQIEKCKQYAQDHKFDVVGCYSDCNTSGKTYPDLDDAKAIATVDTVFQHWLNQSSYKSYRKCYRKGLASALTTKADVLIIYDFTRLMRPLTDSFLESYIKQYIIKNGLIIHTIKDGVVDITTFSASLVTSIESRINDNQIALSKAKAQAQLKKLRDDGYLWSGADVLGYKSAGKQRVEVVPEEIEIVKKVIADVISGKAYTKICREVNSMPQAHHTYNYRDLCKICNRWAYCGKSTNSNGDIIDSKVYPCVIPFADMVQAQARINNRKVQNRDKAKVHPLSRLVYCGYCGGLMSIVRSNNYDDKSKKQFYYKCLHSVYHEKSERLCALSAIREDYDYTTKDKNGLIDGLFPFLVVKLLSDISQHDNHDNHKAELQIELDKISKLEKILDNKLMEGEITESEYNDRFSQYSKRKKEIKAELTKIEAVTNADVSAYNTLAMMMDAVNFNRYDDDFFSKFKMIAQATFTKIVVYGDYVEVYLIGNDTPVKIERIRLINVRCLPKWSMLKTHNGFHFSFKYKYGDGVNTIYQDEYTTIQTIGYNPKPYEYLKKSKKHKALSKRKFGDIL